MEKIVLKDKQGEIFATLQYDSTDLSIIEKFRCEYRKFTKDAKMLKGIQISSDGSAKDFKGMVAVKVMENRLKKMFDTVFGKGSYEMVFRNRRPFAYVGGEFFATSIMRGLGNYFADFKNLVQKKENIDE